MSEPSPRWLSRQRRDGRLPAARGVLGAGSLGALAVVTPLALSQLGALTRLARGALSGEATLSDAARCLAWLALPLSLAAALGALGAAALHTRVLGRAGAGAPGAWGGTAAALLSAAACAALTVGALRASLDGGDLASTAAALAVRALGVCAAVALVLGARALAAARSLRDEAHARDPERDRPREAARR
ncbi:MAG: hypothetical protein IT374_08020 [Polyangiaceae bacterium]|nr:hypothetical protein [Polyangiaceae bacterium]